MRADKKKTLNKIFNALPMAREDGQYGQISATLAHKLASKKLAGKKVSQLPENVRLQLIDELKKVPLTFEQLRVQTGLPKSTLHDSLKYLIEHYAVKGLIDAGALRSTGGKLKPTYVKTGHYGWTEKGKGKRVTVVWTNKKTGKPEYKQTLVKIRKKWKRKGTSSDRDCYFRYKKIAWDMKNQMPVRLKIIEERKKKKRGRGKVKGAYY